MAMQALLLRRASSERCISLSMPTLSAGCGLVVLVVEGAHRADDMAAAVVEGTDDVGRWRRRSAANVPP